MTDPTYKLGIKFPIDNEKNIKGEITFGKRGPKKWGIGTVSGYPNQNSPITYEGLATYSAPNNVIVEDTLKELNSKIEEELYIKGNLSILKTVNPQREEAERKVEAENKKVEQLDIKKDKMDKKISRLSMPKGLGFIILSMLKKTLKSTFKAENSIKLITKQLKDKCPLPKKLRESIEIKNRISNATTLIQQTITTLQTTATSLNGFFKALDIIIKAATAFIFIYGSIPTSPPGPTTLAQKEIDRAEKKKEKTQKIIKNGILGLMIIRNSLDVIVVLLQHLEAIISLCIIESVENGEMNEDDFNSLMLELNTTSTDSSSPSEDKAKGEDLLNSLQPNSKNPLLYKGFRFEVKQNPKNPLETIPQRRIDAINIETNILTVSTDYSFASSTEVLVNEAKFLVDQWLIKQIPITSDIDLSIYNAIVEEEKTIPELLEDIQLIGTSMGSFTYLPPSILPETPISEDPTEEYNPFPEIKSLWIIGDDEGVDWSYYIFTGYGGVFDDPQRYKVLEDMMLTGEPSLFMRNKPIDSIRSIMQSVINNL